MEQALGHDPGHVRPRKHYEAMVAELRKEKGDPLPEIVMPGGVTDTPDETITAP